MKSRKYLFLWLVKMFHNIVHGFPNSLLDLSRIRLCEMMESILAEDTNFKTFIKFSWWELN